MANLVHQALVSSVRLDTLPKSVIDIFVTVIECDGIESCVAAATVAASTSLAKAGIEMLGLVVSCAGVSPFYYVFLQCLTTIYQAVVGEDVWLDPNEEEARLASGMLLCACMPALGVTTSIWQTGRVLPTKALMVSNTGFTCDPPINWTSILESTTMSRTLFRYPSDCSPGTSRRLSVGISERCSALSYPQHVALGQRVVAL